MSGHYHVSAKTGSRKAGKSAVAAAAYRAAEKLHNERDGQTRDFSRKEGVRETLIMAPDDAPDWTRDREALWNRVEAAEKRSDARLYREFEVSLPRGLSDDQQRDTVAAWAHENFVSKGMVADIAIHDVEASDGGRNLHAHVMLTDRPLDASTATGFATKKDRSWNGNELVEQARESWADHANRALEREGREIRLDHRSLVAQQADALERGNDDQARALDREPDPKLGPTANAMEQRGERTERGDLRRHVQRVNEWVQEHARPALERLNEGIEKAREYIERVPKWARDIAENRQNDDRAATDTNAALDKHFARERTADALQRGFEQERSQEQQRTRQHGPRTQGRERGGPGLGD
jgi:hypothetical protein